jgi:hypothetical protein
VEIVDNQRVSSTGDRGVGHEPRHRGWTVLFGSWRGLLFITVLAAALAALAVSQNWIAFATLLPVLYVLPCAVLMYMCMKDTKQ